ncbi:MAG: M20/M25/M40 family metallo-hydrolase [Calditrichae bacterium]|nr:M20/M25/M40 family metallo-hydrolase [Calditrichia bacterium]
MLKTIPFKISYLCISVYLFSGITTVPAQSPDSLVQSLIMQTNLDTLTRYLNILSGEQSAMINGQPATITSRYAGHAHNDLAADYLFETLQKTGLSTYNQNYSAGGRNVYAVQTGSTFPDQQIIVCAHYDDLPSIGLAPGADDDGSGSVTVLETARILSQIQTPYTIIYALWDEEESGRVGSTYYAQQAAQAGENIIAVVNLEMLGWDSNNDGLMDIHTGPVANSVQLANLVDDLQNIYTLGLSPVIYNPGTPFSDHRSFWDQGYTAIAFSQAFYYGIDLNPYYHTSNDRIIHFNMDYFYAMAKLAVASVAHLSHYNMLLEISQDPLPVSEDIILTQNYPNPFNPTTTIVFDLPSSHYTTLAIYNILGENVATLVANQLSAGKYQYVWNAAGLPSGLYLYRLVAGNTIQVRKMILVE